MIQQVAFDIPKEIALGLASGEYVQYGGVVRDAAGHIVKHLEPADVSNDVNKAIQVAAQAIQLAKENKKAAIGVLAVAGVAAAGGAVYAGVTHLQHKKEERARKTAMDDFNAAFSEYLKALGNSELTVEKIDELENAISALSGSEKGCTIEIESEQFKNLVKSVRDYTERLSKANSAKSSNVVFKLFEKKPNDISGLKECLAMQREILTQAA
ncbi:hypothetical protein [Slackia isoflavoniconvertens]|uniref:hypothetical protein n=1 Tax=Slackia isoflavoniconvertens TaxID=572010 RepID=UPI003AB9A0C7